MSGKSQHNAAAPDRLTVRVEDAAELLGISRGAAYARAADGSLPTIRLGRRLLVPRAALEKMLETAVDKMLAAAS
jgi:excisionase family DNA binding protein